MLLNICFRRIYTAYFSHNHQNGDWKKFYSNLKLEDNLYKYQNKIKFYIDNLLNETLTKKYLSLKSKITISHLNFTPFFQNLIQDVSRLGHTVLWSYFQSENTKTLWSSNYQYSCNLTNTPVL